MAKELELAGLGSLGGLARGRRKAKAHTHLHTHCLDCGAELQGPYCHRCGQSGDDHHRSIFHLAWEAVEGLTHLDGRLAKTLPALFFRPGLLARDQIEGRRTRHVPPFRLFLISLVLFLLAVEHRPHDEHAKLEPTPAKSIEQRIKDRSVVLMHKSGPQAPAAQQKAVKFLHTPVGRWMVEHLERAQANPKLFKSKVDEWAHRLAVLLLPIFGLLVAAMYFYKRQFFVYDHLLVAMQFLSFVFLVWSAAMMIPTPFGGFARAIAALWIPVNLFMILRRGYGSSLGGALLKTAVLSVSTVFLFMLLLGTVIYVAMGQM